MSATSNQKSETVWDNIMKRLKKASLEQTLLILDVINYRNDIELTYFPDYGINGIRTKDGKLYLALGPNSEIITNAYLMDWLKHFIKNDIKSNSNTFIKYILEKYKQEFNQEYQPKIENNEALIAFNNKFFILIEYIQKNRIMKPKSITLSAIFGEVYKNQKFSIELPDINNIDENMDNIVQKLIFIRKFFELAQKYKTITWDNYETAKKEVISFFNNLENYLQRNI